MGLAPRARSKNSEEKALSQQKYQEYIGLKQNNSVFSKENFL